MLDHPDDSSLSTLRKVVDPRQHARLLDGRLLIAHPGGRPVDDVTVPCTFIPPVRGA
jgi:hypothetical protein